VTNGHRRLLVLTLVCAFVGTVGAVGVGSYWAGHRAGRGAACFEIAVRTRDAEGRTLASTFLKRASAQSSYSFWGDACTLSIGFPTDNGVAGGRWAFDLRTGQLFHVDEAGARLFPASGPWLPHGTVGDVKQ